ncbi:MAG: UvrD-helicase domain-containing protein [Clostridiales bacterium]|nr:UvrD-helicase domain-containing protein [Clostridiales bacterium]
MKYLLFEQSAIKKMLLNRNLLSTQFNLGQEFMDFIRNKPHVDISIDGVLSKKNTDGIMFVGGDPSDNLFVIDLEQYNEFLEFTDEECIILIQKILRFAIRNWNNHTLTRKDKFIPTTSKMCIFPDLYGKNHLYKIIIEMEPDSERLSKRGLNNLFLVYGDHANDINPLSQVPDASVKNFRQACELYIKDRFSYKKELSEINVSQNIELEPEKSLTFIETDNLEGKTTYYRTYKQWEKYLTKSQKQFINDVDRVGPCRIQGPAGTGKTLALILKTILILDKAETAGDELSICFFAHSESTKRSIRTIFQTITAGKWGVDGNRKQRLKIATLHEFCINNLTTELMEPEILDRDAHDSKEHQYYLIEEAFDMVMEKSFKTYKFLMSDEVISFIMNDSDRVNILHLLQHEFSVQIKGRCSGDLDKYKKSENLFTGIPLKTEEDKGFVFAIFTQYQQFIEEQQVYDTDDIVMTAIGQFDNPIWRRKRKVEGFDYIFIDETHLFNANERMVFHYLTKDIDKIRINFAVDIAQAIGEQGISEKEYIEDYYLSEQSYVSEFDVVFRCSQEITDLAMSITSSGSNLFRNFINPYKNSVSGIVDSGGVYNSKPSYLLLDNDLSMINYAINQVEVIVNMLKTSVSNIALIPFSDRILGKLEIESIKKGIKYEVLKSRGDLRGKIKAEKEKRFIISSPEYIAGLEFDAVILLGVDSGRVPPINVSEISKSYLKYSAYNKLYISITRARYLVNILGAKEYGQSECLEYSIETGAIDLFEK